MANTMRYCSSKDQRVGNFKLELYHWISLVRERLPAFQSPQWKGHSARVSINNNNGHAFEYGPYIVVQGDEAADSVPVFECSGSDLLMCL